MNIQSPTCGIRVGQKLYEEVTLHCLDGSVVTFSRENGTGTLVYANISFFPHELLVKAVYVQPSLYKYGESVEIVFEDKTVEPIVLTDIINGEDVQKVVDYFFC